MAVKSNETRMFIGNFKGHWASNSYHKIGKVGNCDYGADPKYLYFAPWE